MEPVTEEIHVDKCHSCGSSVQLERELWERFRKADHSIVYVTEDSHLTSIRYTFHSDDVLEGEENSVDIVKDSNHILWF